MAAHLGPSRYDAELQMFTDELSEPSLERLRFLRWLAERGRLEHEVAGGSSGEFRGAAACRCATATPVDLVPEL